MTATTPLDVRLGGDLLIEASAGTGKTYALTTLAARLVVEAELPIDRLLVVTFTVAATGELRTRLRRTLLAARDATETSSTTAATRADQRQAGALLDRWRRLGIDEADANARLLAAIRDLDRASILTIHGFCQRLLAEFAFEGGIPFGFQVSGGNDAEVAAAVRDFWRRRIAPALPAQIEFATANRFTLAEITEWVRERQGRAELRIRGVDEQPENSQAQHLAWQQAFAETRAAWLEDAEPFVAALQKLSWHRNSRAKIAATLQQAVAAFAEDDSARLPLANAGYLGGKSLQRLLHKGQQLPSLPLLHRFDELGAAAEALGPRWLRRMRRDLLLETQRLLRLEAWRKRSLSFDALLTETERALRRSARLAPRVRERFAVALIDEFQDTDGLQARIFQSIYPAAAKPSNGGGIAIVGDPKQSIYGFRGADVFAYVEASQRFAAQPGKRLRLATNYRSTPGLVRALNALFARPAPFLLPEITFQASAWPGPEDSPGATHGQPDATERGLALDAATSPAPLQLRLFAGDDEASGGTSFQTVAAGGAATEIAALLALAAQGRAKLHGRALAGADIAVLVRTRAQGHAVALELRRRGVASVEMSDLSIFQTDAADQLQRLLGALATPATANAARLRGALGMDLFALDLRALADLTRDDRAWARWQQRFDHWRRIWQRAGAATLIRRLLFSPPENCVENLLRHGDGARRVTNLLHLADLLQQAETSERLSPAGLVEWLAEQRRGATAGDSAQLRLESDERLVKILTVHRAKGLEFPLVFCPFAWYRRRPWRGATATYHERDANRFHEILDLDPSREAHDRQQVEDHAEELRLLYVALTRAQYRCVVTWARVKGAEHAPLAWLLHGRSRSADAPVAALRSHASHVSRLGAGAWQAEVMAFVDENRDDVTASPLAADEAPSMAADETSIPVPTAARQLQRPLRRIRQMTSYSALAAEAGAAVTEPEHAEVERADHDQREDAALASDLLAQADFADRPTAIDTHAGIAGQPSSERKDAFAFPRGRRAGDCLHQIFEALSNNQPTPDGWREDILSKHGIDPSWTATATDMVESARATLLAPPAERRFRPFRIADLAHAMAEMEFQMPAHLDRQQLARCFVAHGYDNPFETTTARSVDGYLRGFIDLVASHDERWYVIDYKSNWLGDDFAAYAPAALRQAMRGNRYHLQYLIYLTALHRYLRLKLPDYDYAKHIGGAFYLFVRGMRPERPAHAVFHDLPSQACIEAIDHCFGTVA